MSLCTAKRSNGTPCKAQAIRGGNVCSVHGGRAPQVKAKAEERLRAMIDPALGVLEHAMKQKAKQLPAAINAAKEVLDRAKFAESEGGGGLQSRQQIEIVMVPAPKIEDARETLIPER